MHEEAVLVDAARAGDERAFQKVIEPYQGELRVHCYRMLGSAHDADDALQDALLRAWRGLPGFVGRSSLRTWLYKIATNASLRVIERRSRRALPVDCGPSADAHDPAWLAVESGWVEPYPDAHMGQGIGSVTPAARYEQRESVELAMVAAFQHLPGRQRAVLILREVLGFSARETAGLLDTTVASVTSALQRARTAVDARVPDRSQQANLRALGDVRLRRLVEAYVNAWERGDADAILAMLTDDATFSMPPYAVWYQGRADIAAFLPRGPLTERWRLIPVRANGQLAFGCYRWDRNQHCYVAHSVDVLTLREDRISQITAFIDANLLAGFGLPDALRPRVTDGSLLT